MDWNKIKTEYITTDASYRDLAEKYDVPRVTIGRIGKAENWVELRRQYTDDLMTKTLTEMSKGQVERAARLQSVADKLLDKVEGMIEIEDSTQGVRQLAATLKDIKDIHMIKSESDMREQEARIANLRKQAEKDDAVTEPIKVIVEGAANDYSV